MDAEIKREWVAALRSGDYLQTIGALRNNSGFCCLGVLCDLVMPKAWDERDFGSFVFDDGATAFPSENALKAAGSAPPYDDHPFWTLASKNDHGATFSDIADYIEANL